MAHYLLLDLTWGIDAGVAGGATRAALTQHFARAGNAADISAKEGSQVLPAMQKLRGLLIPYGDTCVTV